MRTVRLKSPSDHEFGFYHCISRVVDRRKRLGPVEKEKFVQIMREYEEFCGVRVLTFCVMSNHFHILVEVPKRPVVPPSAEELIRKVNKLTCQVGYGWLRQRLEMLKDPSHRATRQQILESFYRRMWDVSWFIRLLKQRFSAWYNKRAGRNGTLWEERFRSVLVDGAGEALATIAAYIDLNPIRARISPDPGKYRWSGYGEAVAGKRLARQGIQKLAAALNNGQEEGFSKSMSLYRTYLYFEGDEKREPTDDTGKSVRGSLKAGKTGEVPIEKGSLPASIYTRRKVRYFCDGAILGSREFVEEMFGCHRKEFSPKRTTGARRMKRLKTKLFVLRNLRVNVFGDP